MSRGKLPDAMRHPFKAFLDIGVDCDMYTKEGRRRTWYTDALPRLDKDGRRVLLLWRRGKVLKLRHFPAADVVVGKKV
jgi:hypothetical protein